VNGTLNLLTLHILPITAWAFKIDFTEDNNTNWRMIPASKSEITAILPAFIHINQEGESGTSSEYSDLNANGYCENCDISKNKCQKNIGLIEIGAINNRITTFRSKHT
jgi:hypothetical protein